MKNRIGLLAAALVIGALAPQAAAAQTLAGETFASAQHIEGFTYQGECNPQGESTFTYYTWGTADGPVPGTMEEYGTFTLASPSGPVTSYSASYTIDANEGEDVQGTKAFSGSAPASCSLDGNGYPGFELEIPGTYTVTSPFAETGPASTTLFGSGYFGSLEATFGATAPERPASKDDCRDGGYARYGFKNQGECIAWVNHNA